MIKLLRLCAEQQAEIERLNALIAMAKTVIEEAAVNMTNNHNEIERLNARLATVQKQADVDGQD